MKIPYLSGEYVHVYVPQPDIFHGPDSSSYPAGTLYEEWVPNDFTVIHDGTHWHLIGITHPKPAWFTHIYDCDPGDIHEAEWQLFHAVSTEATLRDSLRPGGFQQVEQVLPAVERPNERHEIWAPICWKHDEEYVLLYAPNPMRTAVSKDLNNWTVRGPAFFDPSDSARDPNILEVDREYIIIYLMENTLYIRRSTDLIHYSEPVLLRKGPEGIALESPILKYIDGCYYLFYCIYNGADRVNGSYDWRTYVHASETLEGLMHAPVIAELKAHAPEMFQDERGDWYLASAEWPARGISIAPLGWKNPS